MNRRRVLAGAIAALAAAAVVPMSAIRHSVQSHAAEPSKRGHPTQHPKRRTVPTGN
jgi:hypothetical protein